MYVETIACFACVIEHEFKLSLSEMTDSGTMHNSHNLYTAMFNRSPVLAIKLFFKVKKKFLNDFNVGVSDQ